MELGVISFQRLKVQDKCWPLAELKEENEYGRDFYSN